ncbi:uncharacterized protein LOC143422873 [Xylocopa sonorina]|uniref:uncharacterized protein LOC143422873 n=1 Tax=Xylocopa sonorina TaxID=1818115 RepID=UPI00403A9977
MKSMKAKPKAKKPNGKLGKVKFSTKEVTPIDPDLSQLHPPIDTSVSTLYRVSKVLENGSDEVKSILAHECDLVYECRICRSLFRSLVNFISHKRVYCKEKFDVTFTKISSNDYNTISGSKSDVQNVEKVFEEACGNDRILRSQVCKEEQKKDLISVVNMLQKKQVKNLQTNIEQLCLESIHSNSSAVYQTVESMVSAKNHIDLMKAQVTELKGTKDQIAVLGPNGQVLQSSQELNNTTIIQTDKNDDINTFCENELVCSICNAKFSTKKTLAVHTRTLHTSHRLCYPCPCCSTTFANTWSVYRHLFKVHRKSNEQVRKLRSQIQEKAFIKDTTVAEDLQKEDANKTLISSALRVNETKEWINHLESDIELQRCGGCGKRFERKAALSAHSQYCHRRVAACENQKDTTKVKKMNKVSPDCISNDSVITDTEIQRNNVNIQNSSISTEINNSNETPIRVEAVASLSKADWDKLENGEFVSPSEPKENTKTNVIDGIRENAGNHKFSSATDVSSSLEIVFTNINKHKTSIGSRKRKNKDSARRLTNDTGHIVKNVSVDVNMEHDKETKKLDHVLLMEKKVASMVNFQKLQCLPCKRKFTSVNNLRRHAAIHIGWNRYQCKLCDYKCFVKCDCVAHCNKIHDAQNNRVIIDEMITQIPDDQYKCDQNITLNITDIERKIQQIDASKVVEVSISSEHTEPEVQVEEKRISTTETEVINTKSVTVNKDLIRINGETRESLNSAVNGQNTLGLDPDLRRMVMEVIFGSSETNSTKQTESKKESTFSENCSSKIRNKEDFDLKDGNTSPVQDNIKPQRPIRNKIKPLNKDFIYDLKEVTFRKDSLTLKPFNKPFGKKSPVQEEDTMEKDIVQPSKRFKSVQNDEMTIVCENGVTEKCDIKLDKELKTSLTSSQCHSQLVNNALD